MKAEELKLKDYLHLYLGCGFMSRDDVKRGVNQNCSTQLMESDWLNGKHKDIVPILRKLSSMTEEELVRCVYLMEGHLTTGARLHKRIKNKGTENEFAQWYFYKGRGISIEEEHIVANLSSGENGFTLCLSSNNYYRCYAKLIPYLLSKGFDLFGLIESGLAIEKEKLLDKEEQL
jgi:hypothetical protein